jgi:hypothetical protein
MRTSRDEQRRESAVDHNLSDMLTGIIGARRAWTGLDDLGVGDAVDSHGERGGSWSRRHASMPSRAARLRRRQPASFSDCPGGGYFEGMISQSPR